MTSPSKTKVPEKYEQLAKAEEVMGQLMPDVSRNRYEDEYAKF